MAYAGFWRRNFAITLDLIPFTILMLVLTHLVGDNFFLVNLLYQPICAAYFIFLTSSSQQGTFGQRILKLQIANKDGSKLSILQSVLRYLVWFAPGWPVILYSSLPQYGHIMDRLGDQSFAETNPEEYLNYLTTPDVQSFVLVSGILTGVLIIGGLIWMLPMAFTKEKTGIHDLICKQRAFKTKKEDI